MIFKHKHVYNVVFLMLVPWDGSLFGRYSTDSMGSMRVIGGIFALLLLLALAKVTLLS